MSELPQRPERGDALSAAWAARLLETVRETTPIAGQGLQSRRTPAGTILSLTPAPPTPRKEEPPLPFTCAWRTVQNKAGKLERHIFCYLPEISGFRGDIVRICGGTDREIQATYCGKEEIGPDSWIDTGASWPTGRLRLTFAVPDAQGASYASPTTVGVGYYLDTGANTPAGFNTTYAEHLAPSVLIADIAPDGTLRQHFQGVYRADMAIGDDALQDADTASASAPRTLSIASRADSHGIHRLHGFRFPKRIENPYPNDDNSDAEADRHLLLVRRLSEDGKTAELVYMRLRDVSNMIPDRSEEINYISEVVGVLYGWKAEAEDHPCPADHRGDLIYWDPCAGAWRSLRDAPGPAIAALEGVFWKSGDNYSSCYGASIGNANAEERITLGAGDAPSVLTGAWQVGGPLSISDSNNSAPLSINTTSFGPKYVQVQHSGGEMEALVVLAEGATVDPPPLAAADYVMNLESRLARVESLLGLSQNP